MNFLKKNSARRESSKSEGEKKTVRFVRGVLLLCTVLLLLAGGAGLVWHYLPMYNARFYLTKAALQTRGQLLSAWGEDQGEGEAREDAVKLVADEVEWNGRSVLLLPGGLGISWREQRNQENTFSQGNLDVYFLGSIREGVHYWANQEQVLLEIPGIADAAVSTTQETMKDVVGFSIMPEKKAQAEADFKTLKKDAVRMVAESRIDFTGRDKENVTIRAEVPAEIFDSYLAQAGEILGKGPMKDMKEWGRLLQERRTDGQIQELFFTVNKGLLISKLQVAGLGEASLDLDSNGGMVIGGSLLLDGREILLDSKVYFGNGQEGKRTFQIPELNITYSKEQFRLGLKLSGGYEGSKIPSDLLEYGTLPEAASVSGDGGLTPARDSFLEKVKKLGFDFNQ